MVPMGIKSGILLMHKCSSAANRTIALSKPGRTHERLSFEHPLYKELVVKVKAECVFVCARMTYCKIVKLLVVMWI
jgi:hypothetical protein